VPKSVRTHSFGRLQHGGGVMAALRSSMALSIDQALSLDGVANDITQT
jgi:hypothetical protein